MVDRMDEELGQELPLAFHHEFGFLTSCPTNVGSGLRASVFMHLPGLVLTKEIKKVLHGLRQVGGDSGCLRRDIILSSLAL